MNVIKLLALDVDGVLTDGGIYFYADGGEMKRFHIRDGMGLVRLMSSGVRVAIISGRPSEATSVRMKELGISIVMQGISDKLACLMRICEEMKISREETAYIGDDINDLACIRWVGLSCAVVDAMDEVKKEAKYVTLLPGGNGAVREFCEKIMQLNRGEQS